MGLWILLAIIVAFLAYIASQRMTVEPFQVVQEGEYSMLQIRMCPESAPLVQTSKGYTDCCEGDFLDGKCKGKTLATLSPEHDSIPSVINYWRKTFAEKAKQCPATMPYYFEDVQKRADGRKGCSSQQPQADGRRSANAERSCIIYRTASENYGNSNSCFLEAIRSTQQCPPDGETNAQILRLRRPRRGFVVNCNGMDENGLPFTCYNDQTMYEFLKMSGRIGTMSLEDFQQTSAWSDQLCSNFEKAQKKRLEAKMKADEQARKLREAEQQALDAKKQLETSERERQALLAQVQQSRRA